MGSGGRHVNASSWKVIPRAFFADCRLSTRKPVAVKGRDRRTGAPRSAGRHTATSKVDAIEREAGRRRDGRLLCGAMHTCRAMVYMQQDDLKVARSPDEPGVVDTHHLSF